MIHLRMVLLFIAVFSIMIAGCTPNVSQADIDKAKLDSLTANQTQETQQSLPIEPVEQPPVEQPPIEDVPIEEIPIEEPINESIINESIEETIVEAPLAVNEPTDVTSEGDTPITALFNFNSTASMTNRHVTYEQGFPNLVEVKTGIVEDAFDGQLVWKLVSTMKMGEQTLTGTMWIHKISLKCLKFEGAGGESSCPQLGQFGSSRTSKNVQFVGYTTITASLGEFVDVAKYEGDGVTYWKANNYPVPVKIVTQDGQNVAETIELIKVN